MQIQAGAQAEAKKLGVDLTVTDAQNDASQQANQLQNFTSSGVDADHRQPGGLRRGRPGRDGRRTRRTSRSSPSTAASTRRTTAALVASDNVAGGELAAKALAEKLGGKGKIVDPPGPGGHLRQPRARRRASREGLKAYPGIKVVAKQPADFDRTKGLDVMTNLLQAHPDVNGVFAENDEMALGAIKALGSKAGKSVQVVGFDGTPDGLKAVEDGTLYASVAQQPKELGRIAVENALKAPRARRSRRR